ncbi:MAG: ABC transporter permease [Planctomycetota bacterium]|nr:MAG: ABC transporter permease [Planctomycetota bacterium]REJ88762.1 MAG: ABC transporter permease [Planctomycetota bacterium]REK24980.1 MAG: ABC transporter permease [Planctomycetota bacterium]REK46104.1 MAG: ABC transporter permease [Planctomycetota bacterium]
MKTLPWEYGVRNLFRRPARTALTLVGLTTVILLIFVVVAFIRGLEASLAASGDDDVVLVYALSSGADIENSSIPARTPALLAASLDGIQRRFDVQHISPEVYLGTRITVAGTDKKGLGLVRGVTTAAPLVRSKMQIVEGEWPGPGEVLAGKLAHSKLGCREEALSVGSTVTFDGREWRISGRFTAAGSAFESELWCPLQDMQTALKRQDLSLVAMKMAPGGSLAEVEMFCSERLDLELKAVPEAQYYASLQQHYKPVRLLGWVVVWLIAGAGVFAGLNTMYGAVVGRVRELSTLQAMGFRRRAITMSLIQEAVLLSVGGSLIAALIAFLLVNGTAVRFTMGAFALRVDSLAVVIGCGTGLVLGLLGAVPPAMKAMRVTVVEGIKAV